MGTDRTAMLVLHAVTLFFTAVNVFVALRGSDIHAALGWFCAALGWSLVVMTDCGIYGY